MPTSRTIKRSPFNSLSRDHSEGKLRVGIIDRETFQLPLSGSRARNGRCSRRPRAFFQLPLSGSPDHVYVPLGWTVRLQDFQLPLSGSHHLALYHFSANNTFLSTPSLGITRNFLQSRLSFTLMKVTFNSLSRDHESEGPRPLRPDDVLSTPSLGITVLRGRRQVCHAGQLLSTPSLGITGGARSFRPSQSKIDPFNSLSRDHRNRRHFQQDLRHGNFQLPLSGSHEAQPLGVV